MLRVTLAFLPKECLSRPLSNHLAHLALLIRAVGTLLSDLTRLELSAIEFIRRSSLDGSNPFAGKTRFANPCLAQRSIEHGLARGSITVKEINF